MKGVPNLLWQGKFLVIFSARVGSNDRHFLPQVRFGFEFTFFFLLTLFLFFSTLHCLIKIFLELRLLVNLSEFFSFFGICNFFSSGGLSFLLVSLKFVPHDKKFREIRTAAHLEVIQNDWQLVGQLDVPFLQQLLGPFVESESMELGKELKGISTLQKVNEFAFLVQKCDFIISIAAPMWPLIPKQLLQTANVS